MGEREGRNILEATETVASVEAPYQPERTPPGSPLYTWGVSSTGASSFNCFCSCGWLETGWPNERIAAASLSAHLGSNHGRAKTVPS